MAYPSPVTAVYRNTKNGFVVYGPADLIRIGVAEVHLKSGKIKHETIRGLGAIFHHEDGTQVRYGYLTASTSTETGAAAASKPTSPPTSKIDLDAESFMPDSAYAGEEDVPAAYEDDQFNDEFNVQYA